MILVSHPTGNANVRAVLKALQTGGHLDSFWTALGVSDQVSVNWSNRYFQKRRYPVPTEKLKCHPLRDVIRLLATKSGCHWLTQHEAGWACIDAVYRNLDHLVARRLESATRHSSLATRSLRGVYAYEDGALASFLAARDLQLRCYYDLPIAYWETAQKLLRAEALRLPAWEPTLGGTRDSAAKLERKRQELELADVVFCPSRFVADSIPEWARQTKQIVIAPFGSPPCTGAPASSPASGSQLDAGRSRSSARPLRVLFAGSLTQRKGLSDLFAAIRLLNRSDVELVVMGSLQAPMEFYRNEFQNFTYEPPRPHAQVLELMRSCDVFCLPSIVEGRALVMQEAMSQGLPLIVTPNTGGGDLIHEGVTGFLVPIGNPDTIAEKINWFADHRQLLPDMSRAAQAKAAEYTWEAYGQKIVEAVTNAK